jgi:hypothetical protein
MRAALLALAVGGTACGPKTSFLSDKPQVPENTYYFATLSKRQARAVERLVPPHRLVSRQAKSKREWIYVINDPAVGEGLPRFEFQPLKKCEVAVRLERVSDLQGLGVNAGPVRRQETFTRECARDKLSEAIALLQALATDPFEAAKVAAPEAWRAVAQETQVDPLEAGFAIQATAELITGNPFDPTSRLTLYKLEARSPYQRARDAE